MEPITPTEREMTEYISCFRDELEALAPITSGHVVYVPVDVFGLVGDPRPGDPLTAFKERAEEVPPTKFVVVFLQQFFFNGAHIRDPEHWMFIVEREKAIF